MLAQDLVIYVLEIAAHVRKNEVAIAVEVNLIHSAEAQILVVVALFYH